MTDFYPLVFLKGFTINFSLIVSIGIQNVFVLKQGILGRNSLLIATMCSLIDIILISIGVYGIGKIISKNEFILHLCTWGGILFLFGYGVMSFYMSFYPKVININDEPYVKSLKKIIMKILAVTLLNPSNYLEICVLMASISTSFSDKELFSFVMGASFLSFSWFFSLSFGARFLRPFFENPLSWRVLDFIVGCIMFIIAISFIYRAEYGLV